jgi:uncharacterized protein (DUF427 family)
MGPTHCFCAPTGSRIRAWLDGRLIVDSREAVLLRRSPSHLVYGFSPGDRLAGTLEPSPQDQAVDGERRYDLVLGQRRIRGAVFQLSERPAGVAPEFANHEFLVFGAMDDWREEDETLLCHPRDPFTRVDVRTSSRSISIYAGDTRIASTKRPRLLFETGLPVRYYIPWPDIRSEFLTPSARESICCYKGRARYWHIDTPVGRYADTAWEYPEPLQDGERVRSTVCFYQTALSLYIDGEREERARHYFTR